MKSTVVLLASLLLSTSAGARNRRPPAPAQARDPLSAATFAFSQGDFRRALESLEEAEADESNDRARARIAVLRAQCHRALRQPRSVRQDLIHALELAPEVQLDPDQASPDLVDALQQLRSELGGQVSIRSTPGAQIKIDGALAGTAPVEVALPVGRHQVEASLPASAQSRVEEILVHPHQEQAIDLAFPTPKVNQAPPEAHALSDTHRPPVTHAPSVSSVHPSPGATGPLPSSAPGLRRSSGLTAQPVLLIAGGGALLGLGAVGFVYSRGVQVAYVRQQSVDAPLTVTRSEAGIAQTLLPLSVCAGIAGAGLLAVGGYLLATPSTAVVLAPTEGGWAIAAASRF